MALSYSELSAHLQTSRLSASMWTYLWDFADEGYDTVFGHLRENGLTEVSLAATYHAGRFLAPHNPKRKVIFLEDGRISFQPNLSRYGRIKPLVHSLIEEGHSLATVRHHAERYGMRTNAWVVCCHNTPLGTAYPDIACRNVFGDPLPHNLCPSNDDLRAYLRSLVVDVASHGVGRIELEALQFQGYTHGFHHERDGIPLTTAMRFLLGLCFCPACEQRACTEGIDFDDVRRFTRSTLEKLFRNPSPVNEQFKTLSDLPAAIFDPYHKWRKNVVVSLMQELKEALVKEKLTDVQLRPLVSIDPLARTMVGIEPVRVAGFTGGILVPAYVKDGEVLRGPLLELLDLIRQAELILGFHVGLPESGGKAEFLSRVQTARELGVDKFNFYNYGFIPLEHLRWIREGLS